MDRYVPINKRSKREQKEFYSSQRNTWLSRARTASASSSRTAHEMNGFNPVTRIVPNGKGNNRNKLKAEERRNSRRSNDYGSPAVFVCRDIRFAL